MDESERAIRQLIYSVLELAEATRMTASEAEQDQWRLDDLSEKTDAVATQVAGLKALLQTDMDTAEPEAPLPESGQIVESLDDIFGAL